MGSDMPLECPSCHAGAPVPCAPCLGSGRNDGRRGAGEDYDPGDGRRWIETLSPGEWVGTLDIDGDSRIAFGADERYDRATSTLSYTGAPGNHLATLPAGRLVLEARRRRIERAKALHAAKINGLPFTDMHTVQAGTTADWLQRMAQQSPDLPRAHVSE